MQNLDTSAAINRLHHPAQYGRHRRFSRAGRPSLPHGVGYPGHRGQADQGVRKLPADLHQRASERHQDPSPGHLAYEALYVEKPEFDRTPRRSDRNGLTNVPQVYNADSIGYRPDLVGHEVTEWKELIDPKFKGKAAILDVPAIGIMDAALCFESAGLITYGNKGNMTREEIDFTCNKLIELKKDGHFRATWTDLRPVGAADGGGRGRDPVDVVPAVAAVRVKDIPCTYAPVNLKGGKEGYRGWCNGMGLMKHLEGKKLDAAFEYLNWYMSGWQGAFVSRYGSTAPCRRPPRNS